MKTTLTTANENTDPVTPPRNKKRPGLRPSTPFSPEYVKYRNTLRAGKVCPALGAAAGLLAEQAYEADEDDDPEDAQSLETETTTTILTMETGKDEDIVEEEEGTALKEILTGENHKASDELEAAAESPITVGGFKTATQTLAEILLDDNGTTNKPILAAETTEPPFNDGNHGAMLLANLDQNDVAFASKKTASRGGSLPPTAAAKYDHYQKQVLGQAKSGSTKSLKNILKKSSRGESVHPCMKINKHSIEIGGSISKKSMLATLKSVVKAAWSRHGLFFLPMVFFMLSSKFFLSQEFAICGTILVYYGVFVVMVMFA